MKAFATSRGFTLVETVIVIAVIAILLSIAAPGYLRFGLRAHRAEAVTRLLEAASCQERQRAVEGSYNSTVCLPVATSRYDYSWVNTTVTAFTVAATPKNGQRRDDCGTLSLSQDGLQAVSGPKTVSRCWGAL